MASRTVAALVVLCIAIGAAACGADQPAPFIDPATEVQSPADVWHPVPIAAAPCEGAGAAAVALLRDSGGSVPREVWEATHSTRLVGERADVEAFRAWVTEGVASVPADVRAELAASSWPVRWPVLSCDGDRATVSVVTSSVRRTVATTVVVERSADGWLLVAPTGGTWAPHTQVVTS